MLISSLKQNKKPDKDRYFNLRLIRLPFLSISAPSE